jgi:hypothetical protein
MSLSVQQAKDEGNRYKENKAIDEAIQGVIISARSLPHFKAPGKKQEEAAKLEVAKLNIVSVILKETGYDETKAGTVYPVEAVQKAFEAVNKLARRYHNLQKQDYENMTAAKPGEEIPSRVKRECNDTYAHLIGAVVYNAGLLEEGPGVLKCPGSRSSPDDDAPRTHLLKFNEQVEVRRVEEQPDDRDLRAEQRDEVRDKAQAKQKKRNTAPAQALPGDPVSLADPKSSKGKNKKRPVSPPPPVSNETESENDESVHGGPAPKAQPVIPVVQAVSPSEDSQDLPVVQAKPLGKSSGRAKKRARYVPSPEKQASPERQASPEKQATPPPSSDDDVQFVGETGPVSVGAVVHTDASGRVHVDLSLDDD